MAIASSLPIYQQTYELVSKQLSGASSYGTS